MLFKFLFASAVSQSFGMRPEGGTVLINLIKGDARNKPEGGNSRSTTLARLGEVVASAAHGVAAESLQSLQEATGIVNSILLQSGNATDHMTDDDVALLNSVIDMVDKSIFGSMDSSHQADQASIQSAIDDASLCNSKIAARLGENGDLNNLYLKTAGFQSTLNDLQGDVDDKTQVNNSKFDALTTHMNNIGNAPDCVDFPNAPTKLSADNFFAGSEYVNWYTSQQDAYAPVAEAFETANQNLVDAITAYTVGLAERDVAYCDWKVGLEGGCATFDQCYQDKVDYYNDELKPALQTDMQVRIDAYKAGTTIIAQIRFLLGESTESAPPTDIDTSRFQLTFQAVPPKGECDLSPLTSDEWVPVPNCPNEGPGKP